MLVRSLLNQYQICCYCRESVKLYTLNTYNDQGDTNTIQVLLMIIYYRAATVFITSISANRKW